MNRYDSVFTRRVITVIETARLDADLSVNELIARSGMPRNSYFTKMRGERPLTTDDISALADGLDLDPILILQTASSQARDLRIVPNIDDEEQELEQVANRDETGQLSDTEPSI